MSSVTEDEDVDIEMDNAPDDVDVERTKPDDVNEMIASTLSPSPQRPTRERSPPSPEMSRQSTPMNKPPRLSKNKSRQHYANAAAVDKEPFPAPAPAPARLAELRAVESTPSRKRSRTPQQVLHAPSPTHSENPRRSTPATDAAKRRKLEANIQNCSLVKAARNASVRGGARANGAWGIRKLPEALSREIDFTLPEFLHCPAGCLADRVVAQINQREDLPFTADIYVTPVIPPVTEKEETAKRDRGANRSHKRRKVS